MVEKIECDRCSKTIAKKDVFIVSLYDGGWNGRTNWDLCKDCNSEFRKRFKEFTRQGIAEKK